MRKRTSRRRFLGGAAVAIGLPLALRPEALGQPTCRTPPRRSIVYYLPNGMIMSAFTPKEEGRNWTPSRILNPVAPHKDDLLVLTGLANRPGIPERGAYHAAATGAFITANHVSPSTTNLRASISVDQKIAQAQKDCAKLPSLQLGIDDGRSAGDCDHGYSCAYWNNISWADARTLLPKITSPQKAFDRVFQGTDPAVSAQERERRTRLRKSILDYAKEQAQQLETEVGSEEKKKLDQYLTSVRELERQVEATGPGAAACGGGPRPEDSGDVNKRVAAMTEIMALALQCDATRVISFMLGNSVSNRSFGFINAAGAYHSLSHHGRRADTIERLIRIETWELEQFARLLARLKELRDPDGKSLLDSTCVYLSSEFSDPDSHSYRDLPTIVAGRCGGAFQPGRHIRVADRTPMANLFVSILQAFGLPDTKFGDDGTQPLAGLG